MPIRRCGHPLWWLEKELRGKGQASGRSRSLLSPLYRSIRKGGKVGGRLTDQSVADIVKAHAERVGLDPSLFAGHSLRVSAVLFLECISAIAFNSCPKCRFFVPPAVEIRRATACSALLEVRDAVLRARESRAVPLAVVPARAGRAATRATRCRSCLRPRATTWP